MTVEGIEGAEIHVYIYAVVDILCASRVFKDQMHSGDPSEKVSVCYKDLMLDKEQNLCLLLFVVGRPIWITLHTELYVIYVLSFRD